MLTGLLLVVVGAISGLEDVLEDAEVKLTAAIPIVWTVSQLLVGGAVWAAGASPSPELDKKASDEEHKNPKWFI